MLLFLLNIYVFLGEGIFMLEIFEKIKIRYLILFSFIIGIAIVIGEESGFIIKNKSLQSGLSDTLIIFWIIFMFFKHKGSYKLSFSILKEKSVKIDMIKVLVYHLIFAIGAGQLFTAIIYIIKPTWMNEVLNNTPLTGNMYDRLYIRSNTCTYFRRINI